MPYSIVKLDQDLRLAILEKVGVYSVRFSIQEPRTLLWFYAMRSTMNPMCPKFAGPCRIVMDHLRLPQQVMLGRCLTVAYLEISRTVPDLL